MRPLFLVVLGTCVALSIPLYFLLPGLLWAWVILGPFFTLGLYDCFQTKHTILKNFPVIGHFRYALEMVRPEIQQYFIETNSEGKPFSRENRSVVYQRAKGQLDTLPFGSQLDMNQIGFEWVNHSLAPNHVDLSDLRVLIGEGQCKHPYSASLFNIGAMSFGALSDRAVRALNLGAKEGDFAHNTGEGGISEYHLCGGDLIWQIGTGYFGARNHSGQFCPSTFKKNASRPEVKMIELKLSQGAKPGHGGILPGRKVTQEISNIRNVPLGKDVLSPPDHNAFKTPLELIDFLSELRELSGGKPVGIKLCIGKRREFIALCKAMVEKNSHPDFIAIDGAEGGTGAAPLEFSNHVGTPLRESIIFAHNVLNGYSLRKKIKIIASGKVTTGFDMVATLAVGADITYSARGMMMALGCIQALRCNSNDCPTGIATQIPHLKNGIDVDSKAKRVKRYHHEMIEASAELIGAMGLTGSSDLRPWHLVRRVDIAVIKHYGEIFEFIAEGALLSESTMPETYYRACLSASATTFSHQENDGLLPALV